VVGRYEAVSVRMPYDHRRLLRELRALSYDSDRTHGPDPSRSSVADRHIIADDVGAIFGAVPGLATEMAAEAGCDGALTHLCLVFSAAELSLLPFELATAPRGIPGEGSPLSIQSIAPVVMTRAIPGATGRKCRLDRVPKILFAAASPPGLRPVPLQAHLLALTRALRPWIGPALDAAHGGTEPHEALGSYLRVLPNATLQEIEAACAETKFTHVHVLAHTELLDEGSQTQYALALHGPGGGKELVKSDRFAAALRLPMGRGPHDSELSHPLVVSLASCESDRRTDVVFPTMSLAHALHAAGVPLVVGSLFPLSFPGSVVMTEELYGGLLQGRDPRRVLYDMRHALFRREQRTHDWASVVAYTSLPDDKDLEAQVQSLGFQAARSGIKAGIRAAAALLDKDRSSNEQQNTLDSLQSLDESIAAAARTLPVTGVYVLEGQGLLASSAKSRAELSWLAAHAPGDLSDEQRRKLVLESRQKLELARRCYLKASRAPRWSLLRPGDERPTIHWVLTQALGLGLVLEAKVSWQEWWIAKLDADNYLGSGGHTSATPATEQLEAVWAHASRAELYLLACGGLELAPAPQAPLPTLSREELKAEALSEATKHVELARHSGEPGYVQSTFRQITRYVDWWLKEDFGVPNPVPLSARAAIADVAMPMLEILRPPPGLNVAG
jgi:hypothetical protein